MKKTRNNYRVPLKRVTKPLGTVKEIRAEADFCPDEEHKLRLIAKHFNTSKPNAVRRLVNEYYDIMMYNKKMDEEDER